MKTSTRNLLISVLVIIILLSVVIIVVSVTRPAAISYYEFWDKLYDGDFKAVTQATDTWEATDGADKKYQVNMHNTSNSDVDRISIYVSTVTRAIEIKTSVDAEDPASVAQAEADWETYKSSVTDEYAAGLLSGDKYTDWADYPASFTFKQNNRYGVSITDFIYPIVMVIMIGVFFFIIYRSMKSSGNVASNFGKSKANVTSAIKVRFTDVAGAEEEKEELAEIVEFLKHPAKFTAVGARVPKGVLMVGRPGTGKTLFAKAIAGEANVPFFSISGSDFVEMYVGVGASRVRDLFDQAKKNQPCIVFIDEIDAVGRHRGAGLGGGNDEREQTLNQLLVQMDGFETNEKIIIIAATNRVDILDPALLRPGRFDRQIYVNVPDVRGREAIFKVHARNKPLAEDVDFGILARITTGLTGADIANILNEAAILCARNNRTHITMEDINDAIMKVELGPQKRSRRVTEVDKRITAYHEGGHAIVAKALAPYCDTVHEISIVPRGWAGGYTSMRPDEDHSYRSLKQYRADIAMSLGGRVAEEIVIQDITSGASSDIKHATQAAKQMVVELGMSEAIGPVFYGGEQEVFIGRDYGSTHSYSEDVAAKIDAEITREIKDAYEVARKIILENRDKLDVLVRVLFEKETIFTEEFEMIMNGESAEKVIEFITSKEKKTEALKRTTVSNGGEQTELPH